jgi:hypothetical protein
MQDEHNELKKDKTNEFKKVIICPECGLESEIVSQSIRCLRCNSLLYDKLSINKQCQGNCHKCYKSL